MKQIRACTACGNPVRRPRPGTISQGHRGHVDRALDQSCGTWGWEWRTPTDPDDDLHPIGCLCLDCKEDGR